MLLGRGPGAGCIGHGAAAVILNFPVQRAQRIGDDLAAADGADQVVELVVHFLDVRRVIPAGVKLLELDDMPQLVQPLGGHVQRGIIRRQALDGQADVENILQILLGDPQDNRALTGIGDQALLGKPPQGLPDGSPADAKLFDQTQLRQDLALGVAAKEDVIF